MPLAYGITANGGCLNLSVPPLAESLHAHTNRAGITTRVRWAYFREKYPPPSLRSHLSSSPYFREITVIVYTSFAPSCALDYQYLEYTAYLDRLFTLGTHGVNYLAEYYVCLLWLCHRVLQCDWSVPGF